MDKNGYSPQLIYQGESCYICGKGGPLARHEVFHGPFRQKSKRFGLWVKVCPDCHYRIHNADGTLDRLLKERFQAVAMKAYGWTVEDFRREFGKNYMEEEE